MVLKGITPSKIAHDDIPTSTHTEAGCKSLRSLERGKIRFDKCVHITASSAKRTRGLVLGQGKLALMTKSAVSKSEGDERGNYLRERRLRMDSHSHHSPKSAAGWMQYHRWEQLRGHCPSTRRHRREQSCLSDCQNHVTYWSLQLRRHL